MLELASRRPARRVLAATLVAAFAVLASGCGSIPQPVEERIVQGLFDDASFGKPDMPIDPSTVFALDDGMRDYVMHHSPNSLRSDAVAREQLLGDLFTKGRLQLDYDAAQTRTASEAFEAKRGNCLSLVVLTGAMARELGLAVTYQSVDTEEIWSRTGDMYFLSGHVNVMLGHKPLHAMGRATIGESTVVDFLPRGSHDGRRTRAIDEKTVLAMYMNNRAAETMIDGHLDDAYWLAKEAIRLDPSFLSSYNTLGVIYLRHHDAVRAERVLRVMAEMQPRNPVVLGNLISALNQQGRGGETTEMQARLAKLEPAPPFQWFVQGQLAMAKGEWAEAKRLFQLELAREPDYHEFHFWLAQAEWRLGEYSDARKHLDLAMKNSNKRADHDLYAAKLDRLTAAGVH